MNSAKTYDAYWQVGGHVTREWSPEFFANTLRELDGKHRVLDYGCGFGYSYQRPLQLRIPDYTAADVSEAAIENAVSKGFKTAKISETGLVALPDATFDAAVCSEVFEHLWDPLAAARELHRLLEPGGTLVATVPNFGYFAWRLVALVRAQVPLEPESEENRFRGVHIRFFSQRWLRRLLLEAGFREVKVYGWCDTNVWDVFRAGGPLGRVSDWAGRHLPRPLRLPWLGKVWPSMFAERLRAVAVK